MTWQKLLTSPADSAYDQLADILELPRISEFPRPGDARTWLANDWLTWGAERGFVAGPKTKHGQVIQHQRYPSICATPAGSSGDIRGAMNCAQDARQSLAQFFERARQVCRILAQDKEEPQGQLGDWLATRLTGSLGQALMDRAKKVSATETPAQALEADRLLKRLRPYYPSIRQSLVDIGLAESTADKLILLNKGKESWTFMGLADQLIPVMNVVLDDQLQTERSALGADLKPEPEVIGPNTELIVTSATGDVDVLDYDRDDALNDATAATLNEAGAQLSGHAALIERASLEIPEFVRTVRQRNSAFYRMAQDMIEFQARQHTLITKQENSDLMEQLAKAQKGLMGFRQYAADVKEIISRQNVAIRTFRGKLSQSSIEQIKLKDEIKRLEEQLTDPLVSNQVQKIKEIRALLEGKLDVFELVKNVERVKQMLDALIKAGK